MSKTIQELIQQKEMAELQAEDWYTRKIRVIVAQELGEYIKEYRNGEFDIEDRANELYQESYTDLYEYSCAFDYDERAIEMDIIAELEVNLLPGKWEEREELTSQLMEQLGMT